MSEKEGKLVKLAEYSSIIDAEMVKGMLETNGIEAMVTEEYNPYGQAFSNSRVMVMEYDLEEAKRLLKGDEAE